MGYRKTLIDLKRRKKKSDREFVNKNVDKSEIKSFFFSS